MATFFGEILPVTSRAVDDDEEDDEAATVSAVEPVIRWTENVSAEVEKLQDQKIPCTVFILALSIEANAFSDIYLKPFGYESVGEVLTSSKEDDPVAPSRSLPTDKTCSIHRCRSNQSVFLCQCKVDVLPEHSYAWAKLVYQYKAITYVCFKEKRYMDIADIKAFIPVLQTKPVKDITEVNKNAEQMLRDVVKLHSLHDMMYM